MIQVMGFYLHLQLRFGFELMLPVLFSAEDELLGLSHEQGG